jgi:anti-sigma factor (TIGR02949 family)
MSGGESMDREEMIPCADAMRRVYEYLDGELDTGWADRVREHIEVCRKCYPYFDFERIFLDHVRSQAITPERSERLERRILEALDEAD